MQNIQEGLVDSIYEAAVVGDAWPDALYRLAGYVGSTCGALVTTSTEQYSGWHLAPGLGPATEAYLRSDAPWRGQALPRLLDANWAGFLTDQDLFESDDAYRQDPLITEWGEAAGFHRGAAAAVFVPTGDIAIFQLHRRTGEPPYSTQDVQRLDALRPHLARAAVLTIRWRDERLRSATQALELLGLPAAVLDPGGRVLAANGLIQGMSRHVWWGARDRMALADPAAGAGLDEVLAEATASVRRDAGIRSFAAGDLNGGDPVAIHAIPVVGMARDLFGDMLTLLVVTRPGVAQSPSPAIIQGLFDLTAAEARVAAGLVDGRSISDLAQINGVGVETVRSQVKSILGKTGVQRQAEFVAKFRSVDLPGQKS